jgi:hypothetical protein
MRIDVVETFEDCSVMSRIDETAIPGFPSGVLVAATCTARL